MFIFIALFNTRTNLSLHTHTGACTPWILWLRLPLRTLQKKIQPPVGSPNTTSLPFYALLHLCRILFTQLFTSLAHPNRLILDKVTIPKVGQNFTLCEFNYILSEYFWQWVKRIPCLLCPWSQHAVTWMLWSQECNLFHGIPNTSSTEYVLSMCSLNNWTYARTRKEINNPALNTPR